MARRSRTSRGGSYIEILVTIIIVGLSLLAALNLFGFGFLMTERTGDTGVAYNLARRTLEDVRSRGFPIAYLPEGTFTAYYDSLGENGSTTQAANHKFRVTRTVTTDLFTQTASGPRPSDDAMRSVTIRVHRLPELTLVHEIGTMVVRSGL